MSKGKKLLVTAPVSEFRRETIAKLAPDSLEIRYLDDYPAGQRNDAFDFADIILSLNPLRDFRKKEYEQLEKIEFLQLLSAGKDHLPFDLLPEDLPVAGNSGAYAVPMAEHALGMILALAKRLAEEDHNMRAGEFNQTARNLLLHGKKAAVLGLGGVGSEVARLLRAMNMQVFAMNTTGKTDKDVAFIGTMNEMEQILMDATVIVICLPLNRYTRRLIGSKELEIMRNDAILINIARGEIIDQKAFYNHLKNYSRFKAGIESWWIEPFRHGRFELDYPLLELPNVLASPHNSAMVEETAIYSLENAFRNIRRYLNNEQVDGLLNRDRYKIDINSEVGGDR